MADALKHNSMLKFFELRSLHSLIIDSGIVVMLAQARTTAKSKEAISTMLWLSSFHSERNHQGNMMRQDKKRRRKRKRKRKRNPSQEACEAYER